MRAVAPVVEFLPCPTPDAWLAEAAADVPTLLRDHASLELKAAQQAQMLIRRYGAEPFAARSPDGLLHKMSRLAREELRHFEQVIVALARRGIAYRPLSASRYAATLHAQVRPREPGRLVDTLIVGAIIEARSCERLEALGSTLRQADPELAGFYTTLATSEARHFQDYLAIAESAAREAIAERIDSFLETERDLILGPDTELRFHSGIPAIGL